MASGDKGSLFSRFDTGGFSPGGGGGFPVGGKGGFGKGFVITQLVNDPAAGGWRALVPSLPKGMQWVPLPFTNKASLQMVMESLTRLGHMIMPPTGN